MRLAAGVLLAALAAPAWAYPVYGQGAVSCADWLTVATTADRRAQQQWVLGYLSGVAAHGVDQVAEQPARIWRWIDLYCQRHPQEPTASAAKALASQLRTEALFGDLN